MSFGHFIEQHCFNLNSKYFKKFFKIRAIKTYFYLSTGHFSDLVYVNLFSLLRQEPLDQVMNRWTHVMSTLQNNPIHNLASRLHGYQNETTNIIHTKYFFYIYLEEKTWVQLCHGFVKYEHILE